MIKTFIKNTLKPNRTNWPYKELAAFKGTNIPIGIPRGDFAYCQAYVDDYKILNFDKYLELTLEDLRILRLTLADDTFKLYIRGEEYELKDEDKVEILDHDFKIEHYRGSEDKVSRLAVEYFTEDLHILYYYKSKIYNKYYVFFKLKDFDIIPVPNILINFNIESGQLRHRYGFDFDSDCRKISSRNIVYKDKWIINEDFTRETRPTISSNRLDKNPLEYDFFFDDLKRYHSHENIERCFYGIKGFNPYTLSRRFGVVYGDTPILHTYKYNPDQTLGYGYESIVFDIGTHFMYFRIYEYRGIKFYFREITSDYPNIEIIHNNTINHILGFYYEKTYDLNMNYFDFIEKYLEVDTFGGYTRFNDQSYGKINDEDIRFFNTSKILFKKGNSYALNIAYQIPELMNIFDSYPPFSIEIKQN